MKSVVIGVLMIAIPEIVAGCSGATNVGLGPSGGDDGGQDGTTSDSESSSGSSSGSSPGMEAASPYDAVAEQIPTEGGGKDGGGSDGSAMDGGLDARADADGGPSSCVPNGAGCNTGNPGACATGARVCDGGVSVCQPLVSSQACYTGPAATEGVGACRGGTQSCIGTLGTCQGEILPAKVEDCFNDIDDDCNGIVNDGCPKSLSLGPDRPLAAAGGTGGAPTTAHCPAGAFLTRVDSWFDDFDQHASGVSFYCATPSLVQGATSYSVALAANTPAPYETVTGANSPTDERQDDCGLAGLTAITYTTGLADDYVEALDNHCGTSAVKLQANNSITFDFVTAGDMSYASLPGSTGTFFDQACKPNEVMVGFNLRAGDWFDSIQPICAALLVNYIH